MSPRWLRLTGMLLKNCEIWELRAPAQCWRLARAEAVPALCAHPHRGLFGSFPQTISDLRACTVVGTELLVCHYF